MLKERYTRLASDLHARDALIERTLDAALRPRTRSSVSWCLTALAVCALMVLAVVVTQIIPPPKDSIAFNDETASEDPLLPLGHAASDDLTLLVSNARMADARTLSFDLVIRGDRVDKLSTFDFTPSAHLYCQEIRFADQDEYALDNERHFTINLEAFSDSYWRTFGSMLQMEISQYTSGNTRQQIYHDIDWSAMDFTCSDTDEPLIALGENAAITAFYFGEDGKLHILTRQPSELPSSDYTLLWLSHKGALPNSNAISEQATVRNGFLYTDYGFDITREVLPDYQLITFTQSTGEVIRGSWPFTVDLTPLFVQ